MRDLGWVLICTFLLLQIIPIVSAQADLDPADYNMICDSQILIDVDPETSTPPQKVMDCLIYNDESYSLEISISSEHNGLSVDHDDSVVVGANSELSFEVTIETIDRMRESMYQVKILTEVTKIGELDYSDDEPLYNIAMVRIMQYAAFTFEPQQVDTNEKLIDDDSFEISYIITNKGNARDSFSIHTNSFATPICDEDKPVETGSGASGCVLTTPVSDNCEEELTIGGFGIYGGVRIGYSWLLDPGESYNVTWTVSSNIGNPSCWPTDSDGNYHLEFTHEVSAYSVFGMAEGDIFGVEYDHSPIWIERTVEVTKSNDEGIISSVVPGFESSYLIMCIFLAAMIHNRKSSLY